MNLPRRRFLFASAGIVAASTLMPVSVKALANIPPKLWGDGIHDDTAALQWLIDNTKGPIDFGAKTYQVTGSIILPAGSVCSNGLFVAGQGFPRETPVVRVLWDKAKHTFLDNLHVDIRKADVSFHIDGPPVEQTTHDGWRFYA